MYKLYEQNFFIFFTRFVKSKSQKKQIQKQKAKVENHKSKIKKKWKSISFIGYHLDGGKT